MQEGYNSNITHPANNNIPNNEPTVVKTDVGAKDGQEKCLKCGSTDISINTNDGKLRCNFCRYEFEPEKVSGRYISFARTSYRIRCNKYCC